MSCDPARAAGYRARFAELAADTGCDMCDPLEELLALPGPERRRLWLDSVGHLSEHGHAVIAETLSTAVRAAL